MNSCPRCNGRRQVGEKSLSLSFYIYICISQEVSISMIKRERHLNALVPSVSSLRISFISQAKTINHGATDCSVLVGE